MRIPSMLVILLGAASATAGAQTAKDQAHTPAPQSPAPAPVVLASATDVKQPPAPSRDRSEQPMRRPAPRVTTCRCGDPQPAEEQPDR